MSHAVVVGGSVAGLTAAIALGNVGWSVDVVERDPLPAGDSPEHSFAAWPRPAVPQSGHSHNWFAIVRQLLVEHVPHVLTAAHAAGVRDLRIRDYPPPALTDALAGPGDDDLIGLATRRSTYEWVLRRAVEADPRITFRQATVDGLVGAAGRVPVVTGVRVDGSTVDADLVVDATGRRTRSAAWLAALGYEEAPCEQHDCGLTYYTRYYRQHDPAAPWPVMNRGIGAGGQFPAISGVLFPADARYFSVTIGALPSVDELAGLRDPAAFHRVAELVPTLRPWLAADHSAGVTEVRVLAGMRNLVRTGTVTEPLAHGFVLIGDALMHTDAAFARGVPLATASAFALAQVVTTYADPGDRDAAWRAFLADEILTRFDDIVARDAERTATLTATWTGDPIAVPPSYGDLFWADILRAVPVDVDVWRAINRYIHLLTPARPAIPDEVLARVKDLRDSGQLATPPPGPSPDDIRAALAGATGGS